MANTSTYLAQMRGTPYFKIGRSTNVEGRIAQLQKGLPLQLDLLGFFLGMDVETELLVFARSKRWHLRGEWVQLDTQEQLFLPSSLRTQGPDAGLLSWALEVRFWPMHAVAQAQWDEATKRWGTPNVWEPPLMVDYATRRQQ